MRTQSFRDILSHLLASELEITPANQKEELRNFQKPSQSPDSRIKDEQPTESNLHSAQPFFFRTQSWTSKYGQTQHPKKPARPKTPPTQSQEPTPIDEVALLSLPTDVQLAIDRLSGYAEITPPQKVCKRKLRSLYIKAARNLHPDRHGNQNPEQMASLFREAKECYEIALKKIVETEKQK